MRKLLMVVVMMAYLPAIALADADFARGFMFREKMSGKFLISGKKVKLSVDLLIHIADLDQWAADPNHGGEIEGVSKIGDLNYPVRGTINVLEPTVDAEGHYGHALHYTFATLPGASPAFHFDGQKFVQGGLDVNIIHDMTTLKGTAMVMAEEGRQLGSEGNAILRFQWWNPLIMGPFLKSMTPIGPEDFVGKLKCQEKFFVTVFGEIWHGIVHPDGSLEDLARSEDDDVQLL